MSIHVTQRLRALPVSILRPAALAAAVLVAAGSLAAGAEELRAVEARSLQFGAVNGVAYYTVGAEGYRLVATLASPDGTPVRFESTLLPGQRIVVSIPGAAGAAARSAEFSRQGDRLLVATAPVPTE